MNIKKATEFLKKLQQWKSLEKINRKNEYTIFLVGQGDINYVAAKPWQDMVF